MRLAMAGTLGRMALILTLLVGSLSATGCGGLSESDYLELIKAWLANSAEAASGDADTDTIGGVTLALTYPAGKSPKVFTKGWVFGAKCMVGSGENRKDISDQVKWSGTGSFSPDRGPMSRPIFANTGANKITLSVVVNGKPVKKTFKVQAVSSATYACVGSLAQCPSDAHGCPACPHAPVGPIISGSPNVYVDGKPAARVGDRGVHAACCDGNYYEIVTGDPQVLINGRPAAKMGLTETRHCGGTGALISGGSGG